MKALGVEKNPDPLPGSLDILQCRNGIDTIVEDYKTVPGWDNPYIQNHVVQPLQGACLLYTSHSVRQQYAAGALRGRRQDPVSYTHLDVYKRQKEGRKEAPEAV